jgi:hypothetical protein
MRVQTIDGTITLAIKGPEATSQNRKMYVYNVRHQRHVPRCQADDRQQ